MLGRALAQGTREERGELAQSGGAGIGSGSKDAIRPARGRFAPRAERPAGWRLSIHSRSRVAGGLPRDSQPWTSALARRPFSSAVRAASSASSASSVERRRGATDQPRPFFFLREFRLFLEPIARSSVLPFMKRKPKQREFGFVNHGGKRRGAGRKPKGKRAGVSHRKRPVLDPRYPVMVTMRLAEALPSMRYDDSHKIVRDVVAEVSERPDFKVIVYSVQSSRVGPGRCRPGPPTDPDVRNSRIRLLGLAGSLRAA